MAYRSPFWSTLCQFCWNLISHVMQYISRYQAPSPASQHGRWYIVLQGEISIATWLLQNFLQWIIIVREASYSICSVSRFHIIIFLQKANLKIHAIYQILDTLSAQNMMRWYKERYQLLLGYFTTFCTYLRMIREASSSIYKPLMVHMMLFLPNIHIWKFMQNIRIEVPSQHSRMDGVLQWETFIAVWFFS